MTNAVSQVFFVDSEQIILEQLTQIQADLHEIKEGQVEMRTYQRTHYSTLQRHTQEIEQNKNKIQELELKVSKNDMFSKIAAFLAGAVIVGGIQFLFTQVI